MQNAIDEQRLAEAVAALDAILERHAAHFIHLDRPALIDRLERIREAALAAKLVLIERGNVSGQQDA